MAVPDNPKVGGCYIWVISILLFIFTVSGAIFLVLYMTQPDTTGTSRYPIIGVSLVCLPWFFWLLTFVYRIISRAFGFRMMCFGGQPDVDNIPAAHGGPVNDNGVGGGGNATMPTYSGGGGGVDDGVDGNLANENGVSEVGMQPGSPRRVHFGGIVIIGEDDGGENGNRESPISSSSSSSSSSRHSNESQMPLKLSMAS